jgi:hypothetical protein
MEPQRVVTASTHESRDRAGYFAVNGDQRVREDETECLEETPIAGV